MLNGQDQTLWWEGWREGGVLELRGGMGGGGCGNLVQ